MPADFPSSPTLNQTYTFGGRTWSWNGTGWQLVANSTDKLTLTDGLVVPAASAATPSVRFTASLSTGLYSPGADQLALSTGGTGRLFVGPTGQIGILQSSLATGGFTAGSLRIGHGNGQTAGILLQNTSTVTDSSFWYTDGTGSFLGSNNGFFAHYAGGSERLRIDSSGRLLVGTSTARANLFNSTVSAAFQLEGTGTNRRAAIIGDDFEGALILASQKSGAVGGNTVLVSGDPIGAVSFQGNDGTEFVEAATVYAYVDGTPGANDMPGRLVFSTTADGASSPTERMRIDSAGRVGINATSLTQQFVVSHTGRDGIAITDTNGTSAQANLLFSNTRAAGTSNYYVLGYANAANTFIVYSNGNVLNTNNSYAGISDVKLKENIVDANSQWNDIKALQVRNYNFKEGQTHTQIGLVAQEVELVSPGLVTETPDRDEEGNDLGTVTKSVNYSVLYMKAVKALQEAMERIEALEVKVAGLKAQ